MAFSFTHITHLFLLSQGYSKTKVRTRSSLIFIALVFALHLWLIFLMLNINRPQQHQLKESFLVFHLLPSELSKPLHVIQLPHVSHSLESAIVRFPEPDPIHVDKKVFSVEHKIYELSGQGSDGQRYENIFDPKLRKKLADMHSTNFRSLDTKFESWTDSSGAQVVELGEGRCMQSMPKMFKADQDTTWSLPFKCGKNQGEKMMDNVNADLAVRNKSKH